MIETHLSKCLRDCFGQSLTA